MEPLASPGRVPSPRGDPHLKLQRLKRVVLVATALGTALLWWLVGAHPTGSAASAAAGTTDASLQQPENDDDFFGDGQALSDGSVSQPINRPTLRSRGS